MKINREQYEEAYKAGKKYYDGELGLTAAKKSLASVGINQNSAKDLIFNLRPLLDGQRFTRSLSTAVIDDYLTWILRDYGNAYLKRAVSSVEQHIQYYRSITGAPMRPQTEVLEKHRKLIKEDDSDFLSPEETSIPGNTLKGQLEGNLKTITVNVYERSAKARKACIGSLGTICSVCGFDFGKIYGAIGEGFIHVHHLQDLASIGLEYEVDPVRDLCPVCPNCHAMLHKSNPSFTIAELKKIIEAQKQ